MTQSALQHPDVTADASLLAVEGLTVRFETARGSVFAVNDVSFRQRPGETMALVGESGSGKSTLGLALMGLVRPSGAKVVQQGSVALRFKDGQIRDVMSIAEAKLRNVRGNEIAMIFQEPMSSLNPVYSIEWQICEAIRIHQRLPEHAARGAAAELLAQLGIPDPAKCLRSFPHQLSGGMRQRVMIAIALSCRPSLLIADEPTTALDVTIQAQILALLKRIQKETGMAMLFITHNLGVVAEIAERVMVLYGGRVVEQGATREVLAQPRMPYTQALLRSIPRLGDSESGRDRLDVIPGQVPSPENLPPGCTFHPRCSHARPGLCDAAIPPIELYAPGHAVRCLRWREIVREGTS
ncbi:MAG: ABC transporter ATP-binding protein [Alphaproteobacteria bacterium]